MKKLLSLVGAVALIGSSTLAATQTFSNHKSTNDIINNKTMINDNLNKKTITNYNKIHMHKNEPIPADKRKAVRVNGLDGLFVYDSHYEPLYPGWPGVKQEYVGYVNTIFALQPEQWEWILYGKAYNAFRDTFVNWMERTISFDVDQDRFLRQYKLKPKRQIAEAIFDNFEDIAHQWNEMQKSNYQRVFLDINLTYHVNYTKQQINNIYVDSNTDSRKYENNPYRNLKGIFHDDLDEKEEKVVSLGVLKNNWDLTIFDKLREIYFSFPWKLEFNIREKKDYNPNENYYSSFRLYSERAFPTNPHYSWGKVHIKFIFVTQEFIDKIWLELIEENGSDLISPWKRDFRAWSLQTREDFRKVVPGLSPEARLLWKHDRVTFFQNFMREFNHITATIDNRIKIKHLYDVLRNVQKEIVAVKEKLNDISAFLNKLQEEIKKGKVRSDFDIFKSLFDIISKVAALAFPEFKLAIDVISIGVAVIVEIVKSQ